MASLEDDFGGVLEGDEIVEAPAQSLPSNVIPFPNMRANQRVSDEWHRELARHADGGGKRYRMPSPLDALDDLIRKRSMPTMPWPAGWPELAKRCRLYAGECVGIVGPTGGGKTSFAIQLARAAAGATIPVLWSPLELDPTELDLRIVGNMTATHTARVRDDWPRDAIAHQLAAITDLWRYVDRKIDPAEQIQAMHDAVRLAKRIYRLPPLLVIDYIGKLSSLDRDPRTATRAHAEMIRQFTVDEECYTAILAQPSRANNATLTGKSEIEAATDAIGMFGESSEIEHACAVVVGLNVFKLDDSQHLDAHVLVSKARGTGMEGRQGFRFAKPGGVWSELDYLPATPGEIKADIKKAKKDKTRLEPATPERSRADLNAARASDAATTRRMYIVQALGRCGATGMTASELRRVKGTGKAQNLKASLQELERNGTVERAPGGCWRLTPRGRNDHR